VSRWGLHFRISCGTVTVNTAFEIRRWEYEFSVHAHERFAKLKFLLVDSVMKVDGVLSAPSPEASVVDLGDPGSDVVKLRIKWWTKFPRQHEVIASHDRVLTVVREMLRQRMVDQSRDSGSRAA
jgi:small conductance mechanosensitive channel